MTIEDKIGFSFSRRSVIKMGLAGILCMAGLPSFARAEEDFYASAYKTWRGGDLGKAEVLLKKGVNASAKKQRAECYHFLGYLSAQNNNRDTAKKLYAKAFEVADIKSGYVDQVYEQALRVDFISEGARVVDEKEGENSLHIISRTGKVLGLDGNEWNDYYFNKGDVLQNYVKETKLDSQKNVHTFILNHRAQIAEVSLFGEGYLSIFVSGFTTPTKMYRIYWKVEPKLKNKVKAL